MATGYNRRIRFITPVIGQKIKRGNTLNIKIDVDERMTGLTISYRLSPSQNWIVLGITTTSGDYEIYNWAIPSDITPSQNVQLKASKIVSGVEYYSVSSPFTIYAGTLVDTIYPYILFGYAKPVIEIISGGELQHEITLPRPLMLKEIFRPEIVTRKLYNGKIDNLAKGWWYSAELDFSNYTKGETILLLQPLFDFSSKYLTSQREVIFYPRGNTIEFGGNINYFYKVEIDGESEIAFSMVQNFAGYRGFNLKLKGVERLNKWFDEIVTINTQEMTKALPYGEEKGYGTNYGEDYGENL